MHTRTMRLWVSLSGLMLLAAGAWAQFSEERPVVFSLNLISIYTDNRDSSFEKESTFDISLQPRVDVDMDQGESSLLFSYAPSYRYRTNPSPTQNDTELLQQLMLDGSLSLGPRVAIRLMDNFYMTDDPAVQQYGTTLRRDSSFMLNQATLGANVPLSRRMSANLTALHSMKRYDDKERAKDNDETGMGSRLSVWYGISRQLGIALMAGYNSYDYKSAMDLERGFQSTIGAAGFDYLLNKQTRSELRVGYISATYEDDTISSMSGPYLDLNVTLSPNPSTKFIANASHTIRNSDVFPFASQVETAASAGVKWRSTERIQWEADATYRMGSYEAETIPEGAVTMYAPEGDDGRIIISGGATFSFGDFTSLRVVQSYESTDTDVGEDYDRNSTMLTLARLF